MLMNGSKAKPWFWQALLIGLILTVGLSSHKPTHAASSLGFAISPPTLELNAQPGQTVKGSVKVINLTDLPIILSIDRKNFVAKGEEGQVDLVEENPLYSLAPWFRTPATVEVPPRGTQAVDFTIDVPVNAEPGGRFGSLVFNTAQSKLPSGQSGAAVKQELAALVFLKIAGDANEKIKIESFVPAKKFYEYGPAKFTARVSNLGNVHAKPTGKITIKNLLGVKVATVDIESKNVIPEAVRKLSAEWPRKFLFGFYTATLELKNDEHQVLTANTSFVAVPYRLLALVGVAIVVLYFALWRRRKRLTKALGVLLGRD